MDAPKFTEEQYDEIAAIRAELTAILTRIEALGGDHSDGIHAPTQLEEAWHGVAGTIDTFGPYGIGRPSS